MSLPDWTDEEERLDLRIDAALRYAIGLDDDGENSDEAWRVVYDLRRLVKAELDEELGITSTH